MKFALLILAVCAACMGRAFANGAEPDVELPPEADALKNPQRFYPVPTVPKQLSPAVTVIVGTARDAIRSEQEATKAWLDAREQWRQADAAARSPSGDETATRAAANALAVVVRRKAAARDDAARVADAAARAAVDAVAKAYGLTPPVTQFPDVVTVNLDGKISAWKPAYSRAEIWDPAVGRMRMKTDDELTADTERARKMSATTGIQQSGFTTASTNITNGEIGLFQKAFDSPQTLAANIYHETIHWVDCVKRGPSKVLGPEEWFLEEENAYRREAKFYGELGDVKEQQARIAHADQLHTQTLIVAHEYLTWQDIRTNSIYRGWLDNRPAFSFDAARVEDRGELDAVRETVQEIERSAADLDARTRAEAENRLKSNEDRLSAGFQNRQETIWASNEGVRCGLEPSDTSRALFSVPGANPPQTIGVQYRSREAYRVSLLLIHACGWRNDPSPCNDAMDVMRSNWGDNQFRASVLLTTYTNPIFMANCVARVTQSVRDPMDYNAVRKAVRKYWDSVARPVQTHEETPDDSNSQPSHPHGPRERDDPRPTPPSVPDCLRHEDGRCIHW